MTMRRTIFNMGWLMLALIATRKDVTAAPSETLRPNIVFILADDKYDAILEDASNPAITAEYIANSAFYKFMATQ